MNLKHNKHYVNPESKTSKTLNDNEKTAKDHLADACSQLLLRLLFEVAHRGIALYRQIGIFANPESRPISEFKTMGGLYWDPHMKDPIFWVRIRQHYGRFPTVAEIEGDLAWARAVIHCRT